MSTTTSSSSSAREAFTFLPQGALIQRFQIGSHNLVLNLPSASAYASSNSPYFGETIGRVANRISNAQIDSLNKTSYPLTANNGPNTLHGGPKGWGKRIWEGPKEVTRGGRQALEFRYTSAHLEEGFPGTVEVRCWYFCEKFQRADVASGKEVTSLEIEYEAELVGDEVEETAVAVTNHSYFNLSGKPTIEGTRATLATNLHLAVDDTAIPTGEILPYPGITANEPFTFTSTDPSPDHCFVLAPAEPANVPLDTRTQPLRQLCSFSHPDTGVHFEALSTEPAFQFYDGQFINVPEIEGMAAKGKRAGFCVEASRYVNAINRPEWRGMVVLPKGKVFGSRTVYRGWTE